MNITQQTTRRGIMATVLGLGAIAVAGKGLAFAQDAMPGGRGRGGGGDGRGGLMGPDATPEEVLARIDEAIAQIQADRDAVAATSDVSTVDSILTMAIGLRDQLDLIDPAADAEGFRRTAGATGFSLRAAHEALEAAVAGVGLPSQSEHLAEHLVETEDDLADLANNVVAAANADAQAALDMANSVFAMAQDANDAGSFEAAEHLARAAGGLGNAAAVLIGERPSGHGEGGRDGGRNGGRDGGPMGGSDMDEDGDDATATPTV